MTINELFTTESTNTAHSGRALSGTAELTRISGNLATDVIRAMEADIENYRDLLTKSASDNNKLDEVIETFVNLEAVDAEFLKELDSATVDGMLKSQQSKRSRCKSKTMTLSNYNAMLTAAIAEHIIRTVCNKPKANFGGSKKAGIVDYTPAQLEMFAADQESLRKEIRNLQSKKSIMKSKADFDETDERWQSLLRAEAMLKDLRIGGRSASVIEVDTTKDKLAEMLSGIDVEHLKAAESKELLASIMDMLQ